MHEQSWQLVEIAGYWKPPVTSRVLCISGWMSGREGWENEWAQQPEHSGSQAIYAVTDRNIHKTVAWAKIDVGNSLASHATLLMPLGAAQALL